MISPHYTASTKPLPPEPPRNKYGLLLLLAIVLVVLALMLVKAFAHDHEHPGLNQWYQGLHNKNGVSCCDGSEAIHLADVDWDVKDGHYRVHLEGNWIDVPDDAVVKAPNLDGRTLVWPIQTWFNGINYPKIRCFMPGAGT